MDSGRTVEDRLRAEYFDLLSDIRRTLIETETRVRHALLPITLSLERYERLIVTSRVKECESAVNALRRRQPLATFDADDPGRYSLKALPDLAAVRITAFPERRVKEADDALHSTLANWISDPLPSVDGQSLGLKYFGTWPATDSITAEIQIVPLLIGVFLEVEHSAIYKPTPNLAGVVRTATVTTRRDDVFKALRSFEAAFSSAIDSAESDST